jgi:hypothetical protein
MAKPSGWFFISLVDHWAASAEWRRSLDSEAKQALENPETIPILVISKYRTDGPQHGVAPSITVYNESIAEVGQFSALQLLQGSMSEFEIFARDISLIQEPSPCFVRGAESAAASIWNYSETVDGHPVRVIVRTLMTVSHENAQTFHFFEPEGATKEVAQELTRSERTISFAEA